MIRCFTEHNLRNVTDLEGLWDFSFLGDVDPDAVAAADLVFNDRIAVPGCFDASPKYAGKRGLTAYRRQIRFVDASRHRFTFNGVHHWCRVSVIQEGEATELCDHTGGFTVFSADSTSHAPGSAYLVVLVDNRFDYGRCPTHLDYFDWYHYGGITRGAEMAKLGDSWIESIRITTIDYLERRVSVSVTCRSDNADGESLAIYIDGVSDFTTPMSFEEGNATVTAEIELPDAELWSPDAPVLHLARVTLGDDDKIERFGIRQVAVDGSAIEINGEEITLLGFCRHEAHPQFGCGLPKSIHIEDLQLAEEMNSNFIRGSHYPQDPAFLDLCDERGICVWEEALGWQHTVEHMNDPEFIEAQITDIREMIAASANHPCVIMWGLQNESHSETEENRNGYKTLIGEIRSLDDERPVTYASNRWPGDKLHDLIDIISINMYPGWYTGEIAGIPEQLDAVVTQIDESTSRGKPVIISEIGAGAVLGTRDRNRTRWSEEYQARLIDIVIEHLFEHRDRVCGLAIWQFCDCRTSEQVGRILMRPRGFNNKGVVDEYRRPKLAFDIVKSRFSAIRDR